jgi:hypothetical protein
MIENQDYIFVPKIDVNEGITSGTVSKAALYCSKNYFYIIPFGSVNIWNQSDSKFINAETFIKDMNSRIASLNIDEFQEYMRNFLPAERVYHVHTLEKFSVQVGFFIFGGVRIKKPGEGVQVMNVQPKAKRLAIKNFYGLK